MTPQVGKKYTLAQVQAMAREYPNLVIPGHVLRRDDSGMYSIVPENQAATSHGTDNALRTAYRSKEPISELFPQDPIKKRTPQERLDSMTARMAPDTVGRGGFPGLSDEKVSELVGYFWKRGRPVTAADVRAAAATLLQQAEAQSQ